MLRRVYWLPIFILFVVLRLFSGYMYIPLAGDPCNFLTLARNFPFHTLFNDSFYLIHPPLFSHTIGFMARFLPLLEAGYLVTLLFSVFLFFAVKRLAHRCTLSPAAISLTLLYLTLSKGSVVYETGIHRTPMLLVWITLALLSFLKVLRSFQQTFPWVTLVYLVLALLSSDQGLVLFPCLLVLCLLFPTRRNMRVTLRLLGYGLLFASLWPLVRLAVYLGHTVYPAGIDGLVEFVSPVPWKGVLQPNYLALTHFYRSFFTANEFSLRFLDFKELLTLPFSVLFLKRPWVYLVLGLPLLFGAGYSIIKRDRTALALLLLSLLLYIPCLFGMHDWYGLGYLMPFAVLLGKSLEPLLQAKRIQHMVTTVCAVTSLLLAGYWLSGATKPTGAHAYRPTGGRNLLFERIPLTRGQTFVREELQSLPDVGFMAPVGLTPELTYLSGKRFVALSFDPKLLEPFIKTYQIKYLIFSQDNLGQTNNQGLDLANSKMVTDFIQNHPDKFSLIKTYQETYPDIYRPDTFYLYEVNLPAESLSDFP